MPSHWLVDVERVQARDVSACKPHVAHDDELEWIVGIYHPLFDRVALGLGGDVAGLAPLWRVYAQVAGHHHLHRRASWQGSERIEHPHAVLPRHAHHHPLAVERCDSALAMAKQ